jgi:CheY-like chemotaxis protein
MEADAEVLYAHLERMPEPLSHKRPAVGARLDAVIATAMAKEPSDRYASCGAVVAAAGEALGLSVPDAFGASRQPAGRVLLLGAGPLTAPLVRGALAGPDYDVDDVADAREALERGAEVVVVDAGNDPARALDACRTLRAARQDLRILAVRKRSQPGLRPQLLGAGADDELAAPFSALQIGVAVRDLVLATGDTGGAGG